MKKLLIFGAGRVSENIFKNLKIGFEVAAFIDNDIKKQGTCLHGKKIISPKELNNFDFDYILISSPIYAPDIYSQIKNLEDNGEIKNCTQKIISFVPIFEQLIQESGGGDLNNIVDVNNIVGFFEWGCDISLWNICKTMAFDKINQSLLRQYSKKYMMDYTRYRTFELCADEIIANNVDGAAAEVGVYQGEFAKLINEKLKDKNLYLFDTFEGFDESEFEADSEQILLEAGNKFSDTNVDLVMSQMKYKENVIIKKGFFPDTSVGLEDEKYCFVSIDVDLTSAIYNSLEYFYPRLQNGGYIFVHEYNDPLYAGPNKAVKKYEEKYGKITKVPISDNHGTLVITK